MWRIVPIPAIPSVKSTRATIPLNGGVRQQLEAYAKARTDVRIIDGRFMTIQQVMGTPKGREAGAKYLAAFVEDMKASGFVADGPG